MPNHSNNNSTFKGRYKGPVANRNYEDLDDDVERQAFTFEAQERAQGIAQQFGSKTSFMRMVALELFRIAENRLKQ